MTKITGKMIPTFNPEIYLNLLVDAIPKVIETEEDYDRALLQFEKLHAKKQSRTPEERALYRLLVIIIETYEKKEFPMPKSLPHEMLQHIMEHSGTRQVDLVGVLGSSGVVSEIVNGKRAISKAQAKALGDRFKVSPSLFI
jgi:HTH-type transcriptional regulator / antitoxin HigA